MKKPKKAPLQALVVKSGERALTAAEFQHLAKVPPESDWFASIASERTRRAYRINLAEFIRFVGLRGIEEFRIVRRAHLIAWVKVLKQRGLAAATIRQKLATVSSLFNYLCSKNAMETNPADGLKGPKEKKIKNSNGGGGGKTPALSDQEARSLLNAPDDTSLRGIRDRALLAVALYHGLRREELVSLTVGSMIVIQGVPHLRILGKGEVERDLPLHVTAIDRISKYVERAGHHSDKSAALFRPIKNNRTGQLDSPLTADGFYKILRGYAKQVGIKQGVRPHMLRATAATNALINGADIAKVQMWLGHADIQTTRIYDQRKDIVEDSPTFKVSY